MVRRTIEVGGRKDSKSFLFGGYRVMIQFIAPIQTVVMHRGGGRESFVAGTGQEGRLFSYLYPGRNVESCIVELPTLATFIAVKVGQLLKLGFLSFLLRRFAMYWYDSQFSSSLSSSNLDSVPSTNLFGRISKPLANTILRSLSQDDISQAAS